MLNLPDGVLLILVCTSCFDNFPSRIIRPTASGQAQSSERSILQEVQTLITQWFTGCELCERRENTDLFASSINITMVCPLVVRISWSLHVLKLQKPEKFGIMMEYCSITCNFTIGNLHFIELRELNSVQLINLTTLVPLLM